MLSYKTPAQILHDNAEAAKIVKASDPGNRHGRADLPNPAKPALVRETPDDVLRRVGYKRN